MSGQTTHPYLRDAVLTATPEQLQLMLYDGAIRFATQGKDALLAKDYEAAYDKLSRAQAIVFEMENGLRHEINPDLCRNMAAIYGFIYSKLVNASVTRNTKDIDAALKVLHLERETWALLLEKVSAVRAAQTQGPADDPVPSEGGICVEG